MASDDVGLWCPECGYEYRPGFVVCSDCHVALVLDEPPPRPKGDSRDHGLIMYDLSGWTADDRAALRMLMTGAGIAHQWEGTTLVVPRVRQDDVEDLVANFKLLAKTGSDAELPEAAQREDGASSQVVASPSRRLLGVLVDGIIGGVAAFVVDASLNRSTAAGSWASWILLQVAYASYVIMTIAIWGRTLGKVVAGTRVVVRGTSMTPGWGRAAVRWAVPSALSLGSVALVTVNFSPALRLAGWAWIIIVYAGVVAAPLHQGLHDRAAHTIVIVERNARRTS